MLKTNVVNFGSKHKIHKQLVPVPTRSAWENRVVFVAKRANGGQHVSVAMGTWLLETHLDCSVALDLGRGGSLLSSGLQPTSDSLHPSSSLAKSTVFKSCLAFKGVSQLSHPQCCFCNVKVLIRPVPQKPNMLPALAPHQLKRGDNIVLNKNARGHVIPSMSKMSIPFQPANQMPSQPPCLASQPSWTIPPNNDCLMVHVETVLSAQLVVRFPPLHIPSGTKAPRRLRAAHVRGSHLNWRHGSRVTDSAEGLGTI